MVESVGSKALELAEKSPANRATVDTSQVQSRYNSVKEQAKVPGSVCCIISVILLCAHSHIGTLELL